MTRPTHIPQLLRSGGGGDIAFSAPGRPDLTYDGLRDHVRATVAALNERGIGRGDRVAIVLPNGPEMASAFVAIAAGATTAPLNPAYRQPEFEFYLEDLGAKALVVAEGDDTPARAAAAALGVPAMEIRAEPGSPAGTFSFVGEPRGAPAGRGGMAGPDDVALVLHTSGTTSRPKIVPLLHRNVCATAENIRRTLRLEAGDRCLNVMPLFHIHGLMACVLSTLHAGASVYCAPGFNALRIFGWLADADPTWYSAVPTMHQAILARAGRNAGVVERLRLRFIRSSSAALPSVVMAELEDAFGAPVVEAYAMTEAAHQMTCNPLPPAARKPGTVGIAAGPDVSVMDAAGNHLAAGEEGEIVIRGPNVTPGYENNEAANREAFTHGWFRTGDQGFRDADGYFTITGRLKEIINRGGEKISPREVDEVLMDHPAVQQVVTFAMPHPKLGEEVAAAVVLRDGAEAGPGDVRDFAAGRLAGFKVPRKVVILDEIPKGPTGKLRRIGLADQLGLGSGG
ncbi:MAG: AMP-binding protein [Gemmatimonadetes bacterium]|nr:AMP-binding protein [Gemmatimonadota bacterium]MXX73619.1 AMP-binding protein [Gemmatimonadota bacterium]